MQLHAVLPIAVLRQLTLIKDNPKPELEGISPDLDDGETTLLLTYAMLVC